jgi:catechol 2,3-dioxygenase-like lactoylglutathione lyase family enzyme
MVRMKKDMRKVRAAPLFLGLEHLGLYPKESSAERIIAWYEETFGFTRKEEKASFFLSGSGTGRLEIMKKRAEKVRMHVAVQVSNFEEAVEALKAKGIPLGEPLIEPELKIIYLREPDPEGNLVHLWWAPQIPEAHGTKAK